MALDYGRLYIDRTGTSVQLLPENIQIFISYKPIMDDLPEEDYITIELGKVRRIVKLRNVYFKTKADAELFLDRMHTKNDAGGMNLEIRDSSAAMPGSLFNFRSGKYTMPVFCLDIMPIEKIAYGDGTIYRIASLKFRQSSKFA